MKLRLICALTLLLAPVGAYAVDGTILINQSTVLAAGGFPYKILASGSYKLSGNLVAPGGTDGIDILISGVTLDLNGFTVSGPGQPCSSFFCAPLYGVSASQGVSGITVRNGIIQGFAGQIQLGLTKAGLLEDLILLQGPIGFESSANSLGTLGVAHHITSDRDFYLTCPAVLTESAFTGISLNGTNPASCVLSNTVGTLF